MPMKAPRICQCGHRIASGELCPCERQRKAHAAAQYDKERGSAYQRGYDKEWQRESKAFLARPENRLCACGCGRMANVVDHKLAHKGNRTLFWDRSNWQPMNRRCNSRKNVKHEGGFGRAPQPPEHRQGEWS